MSKLLARNGVEHWIIYSTPWKNIKEEFYFNFNKN